MGKRSTAGARPAATTRGERLESAPQGTGGPPPESAEARHGSPVQVANAATQADAVRQGHDDGAPGPTDSPHHRPSAPVGYQRYHIDVHPAAPVVPHPARFRVVVRRSALARLLVGELLHYRARLGVVLSRPCVYGVFSGALGGFAPRDHLCVGCLRCTTQYPDVVSIFRNPARQALGDSYFGPDAVDTVNYEAETGSIPVRGAGYRGRFGGTGWDGMWTDMSEIVRPTRDGIHGREFISTAVQLGPRPPFLSFADDGQPIGQQPQTVDLPLPLIFDAPPAGTASPLLPPILLHAAAGIQSLAILPLASLPTALRLPRGQPVEGSDLPAALGQHAVPLVSAGEQEVLAELPFTPAMIELAEWDEELYRFVRARFPASILALRLECDQDTPARLLAHLARGLGVFHLVADFHGRGGDGRFVLDHIRDAHRALVGAGRRDEVTLIGSGGIITAEHVPKAIICGLDSVALDTTALVALQARFGGECADRESSRFELPRRLELEWGRQRLMNLAASWRDQLLEIMGAMGLREVRRLRGEVGRAMFQTELEREAFEGIAGYGHS